MELRESEQRWIMKQCSFSQLREGTLPFHCQNNERLNTVGYYNVTYKEKVSKIDPILRLNLVSVSVSVCVHAHICVQTECVPSSMRINVHISLCLGK